MGFFSPRQFCCDPHGYLITFLIINIISTISLVVISFIKPNMWLFALVMVFVAWIIAMAWYIGFSVVPLYKQRSQIYNELEEKK